MTALTIQPKESDQPYYAKLRAEASWDLLNFGSGQIYLGFFMDPLYKVHWNNLADPVSVELETSEGLELDPKQLAGPAVDVVKDKSHRAFLIDVTHVENLQDTFSVEIRYHACGDDNTWCTLIKQRYKVHLVRRIPSGLHDSRLWNGLKKKWNPAWDSNWTHRFDV